jgi:hypothetical protein
VAAGENQTQTVVDHVRLILGELHRHVGFAGHFAAPPAQPVDGLEPPRGNQPRARIGRDALDRPLLDRCRERILQRLLGEIEIAEEADERRENPAGLGAINRLDRVYGCENS